MEGNRAEAELVAACGLYCGNCGAYLKGKCPGCAANEKASWCTVRLCCRDQKYSSCAECGKFQAFEDCGKLNNFISKVISIFTRSDRPARLRRIKEIGREAYAAEMVASGSRSVKKK